MNIPLSRPDITEFEKKEVLNVLNTPFLSLGPKLIEFENKFANYIGSRYAISVNSGTSGLHLCIKALNIKAEEEVLTTPFSFVSSANCILYEQARPIFVDIDEKTMNIDATELDEVIQKLRNKGHKLRAILPVHVFGRPCEIWEIMKLAARYNLQVIEDACEAIGAEYCAPRLKLQKTQAKKERVQEKKDKKVWRKVGIFGDCSVFAFYPNKQITTGEGGMITTDDENIYRLCKSLRNQGRLNNGKWLQHEYLGYNYRISDINCALGIAQLERINEILTERDRVAKLYNERLKGIDELVIPQSERNKKISWFVYVVRLKNNYSQKDRDWILNKLRERGIGCSDYFSPIHLQPFYRKLFGYKKGDFPQTEKVAERTIALPFYNKLSEEQIDFVCKNLKEILHAVGQKKWFLRRKNEKKISKRNF